MKNASSGCIRCGLMAGVLCVALFATSGVQLLHAGEAGLVRLEIAGLQQASGNLYISVYDSDDTWLGENPVLEKQVVIAEALADELVLAELELPPGDYAISMYYDVNGNGKLDTNFIGIPREPVALSNNAGASFGPPKYKDAVFTLGAEPVVQRIQIESL